MINAKSKKQSKKVTVTSLTSSPKSTQPPQAPHHQKAPSEGLVSSHLTPNADQSAGVLGNSSNSHITEESPGSKEPTSKKSLHNTGESTEPAKENQTASSNSLKEQVVNSTLPEGEEEEEPDARLPELPSLQGKGTGKASTAPATFPSKRFRVGEDKSGSKSKEKDSSLHTQKPSSQPDPPEKNLAGSANDEEEGEDSPEREIPERQIKGNSRSTSISSRSPSSSSRSPSPDRQTTSKRAGKNDDPPEIYKEILGSENTSPERLRYCEAKTAPQYIGQANPFPIEYSMYGTRRPELPDHLYGRVYNVAGKIRQRIVRGLPLDYWNNFISFMLRVARLVRDVDFVVFGARGMDRGVYFRNPINPSTFCMATYSDTTDFQLSDPYHYEMNISLAPELLYPCYADLPLSELVSYWDKELEIPVDILTTDSDVVRYAPQDAKKPLLQTPMHNTKDSAIVLDKEDSPKNDSASLKDKKSQGESSKDKKPAEPSQKTSTSSGNSHRGRSHHSRQHSHHTDKDNREKKELSSREDYLSLHHSSRRSSDRKEQYARSSRYSHHRDNPSHSNRYSPDHRHRDSPSYRRRDSPHSYHRSDRYRSASHYYSHSKAWGDREEEPRQKPPEKEAIAREVSSQLMELVKTHFPTPPSTTTRAPRPDYSVPTLTERMLKSKRPRSPVSDDLSNPIEGEEEDTLTNTDEELAPRHAQTAARRYKSILEYSDNFHDYQVKYKMYGIVGTERPSITSASVHGQLQVMNEPRRLTILGENDVCGKVHVSKAEAVTPQVSNPPKDLYPEDALKNIGIKVMMGRSESNEAVPVARYNGAIPNQEACFTAFNRAVTSFIPFMTSLSAREEVPNDDAYFQSSVCMDNFFNKAAGGWSSAIMGDQLMSAIQWNDIMAMALHYKEEINRQRRMPGENDIIQLLATGGDLLSPAQKRALEQKQRDTQILHLLLNSQTGGDSGGTPPTPKITTDTLKLLPPPPQTSPIIAPDLVMSRGNPPQNLIPESIVSNRHPILQIIPQRIFPGGGRERGPHFKPIPNKQSKNTTFSLPPSGRKGK
jgi:hypothetical protein